MKKINLKKIPDEKFSWSRVIAMLDIVFPIFFIFLSLYFMGCFETEYNLYSKEYPFLLGFDLGIVAVFLISCCSSAFSSIHNGLKVLKEDKGSEKNL